ncbi:hypothetical protein BDR07DRAFT_1381971 [Suillus spraguei]|nr:hypothetical protein BDR07DRAFT_1381971 [Suillus spraguei]
MARPVIHKTLQARMEAAREKSRHHYAKHRGDILQRWKNLHTCINKHDKEAKALSKEISRAVKKALHECDDNESEPDTDSDESSDNDEIDTLLSTSNRSDLPSCLLAIKHAKDDMLRLIGADPCKFAKDKLTEYVKSIPDDCKMKGDVSIIANSVAEIEKLLKRVIFAQNEILNFCGISPEWHAADSVSQFLRTTVAYLEDIQVLEMSGGVAELTTAHLLGELMYQMESNMVPWKWTSPKQEEWLSPWYEKYHMKQSDKAKNWANFFTDLLGEWLEQFLEPRPATLPLIGPLTMDEIIIMDQAEADRKKKLENCFKNSIGATKTGRQAKAEAVNVFHAVLKAVAEELRAENQALTNGKCIAIVKKETANLYEVETSEVKAEVRRYIEDAKTCKDKEKEGMWSEDDYAK